MLREMAETWLEVALNGSWSRAKQRRIPVSVMSRQPPRCVPR
jgi:hypothetical protein